MTTLVQVWVDGRYHLAAADVRRPLRRVVADVVGDARPDLLLGDWRVLLEDFPEPGEGRTAEELDLADGARVYVAWPRAAEVAP